MILLEKAFFLKKTILFAELDLDVLLAISDKMTPTQFSKGEEIFQSGREAVRIYFLVQGHVSIGPKELKKYDFFGEEALFNEKVRTYSAFATSNVELLTLSKTHLLTIISEYPLVAITLLQIYSEALPNRYIP